MPKGDTRSAAPRTRLRAAKSPPGEGQAIVTTNQGTFLTDGTSATKVNLPGGDNVFVTPVGVERLGAGRRQRDGFHAESGDPGSRDDRRRDR